VKRDRDAEGERGIQNGERCPPVQPIKGSS